MFDYEKIMKMTPDEIKITAALAQIAEKAQNYEKMIHEVYLFHIGEEEINVYSDASNVEREYLTRDGVWIWKGNTYKEYHVDLTAKNIYELFVAGDIIRSNIFQTMSDDEREKIEARNRECNKLLRFLNETAIEYYKLHPEEDKAQS